jgi:hypothetical protein
MRAVNRPVFLTCPASEPAAHQKSNSGRFNRDAPALKRSATLETLTISAREMKTKFIALGIAFLGGALCFAAEPSVAPPEHTVLTEASTALGKEDTEVNVDTQKPFVAPGSPSQGKISARLYGSNWANWVRLSDDLMMEKTAPLNLKIIRLGGSQISRYNWRNNKYTFPDKTQVYEGADSIGEFVRSCRRLGAEPLIQINVLGWAPNPRNRDRFEKCLDVQDAVDLLVHLNRTKKYGIRYFEIDNEFSIWHETHSDVVPKAATIADYTELYLRYAYALKKAQAQIGSPQDIEIFGPVACEAFKFDSQLPYFLKKCAEFEKDQSRNPEGFRVLDVLSFHYYPLFRTDWKDTKSFIPEGVPAMLESVQTWWNPSYVNRYDHGQPLNQPGACLIPKFHQEIADLYPGTKLAITEVNVDSGENVRYDPVMVPLYMADLYGVLAKYGLDYVMQYDVAHNDSAFGLISHGLDNPSDTGKIRPAYYPLMLYSQHFKGTVLTAQSSRSDQVNVYACNDGEKHLVLMIVNKDAKDHRVQIRLSGYQGNAVRERFGIQSPGYSLTCMRIPMTAGQGPAEMWVYGEKQIRSVPSNGM